MANFSICAYFYIVTSCEGSTQILKSIGRMAPFFHVFSDCNVIDEALLCKQHCHVIDGPGGKNVTCI